MSVRATAVFIDMTIHSHVTVTHNMDVLVQISARINGEEVMTPVQT